MITDRINEDNNQLIEFHPANINIIIKKFAIAPKIKLE